VSRGDALVLVGARGAGKSTLAATLAATAGCRVVETDALVEAALGATVAALFAAGREADFRAAEARVVASLGADAHTVVSTGGGAVLAAASRAALRRLGLVVWLVADPATLGARVAGSGRPSLTGADPAAEIAGVLATRAALYSEAADAVVSTDRRGPEEVADELQRLWRRFRDRHVR
jgi:shikimate kinase